MKHIMHLDNKAFNLIKEGEKKIELRLYDEKRQAFKEKDVIELINRLSNERVTVEIENIYKYNNFEELYKCLDNKLIIYSLEEMEKFYSKDEQNKFGVIGIKIKLL